MEFDERGWDLAAIIPALKIPTGYPVPRDVIASILYATCNDVGESGERKTLSKMNTTEASKYFERCRDYPAIRWRIAIPEPNPNWKENQCE